MKHPRTQAKAAPTMLPCADSCRRASEHACLAMLIMATIKLPRLTLPKEYVVARRNAPRVDPLGIPPGALLQKYHDPYKPAMVV